MFVYSPIPDQESEIMQPMNPAAPIFPAQTLDKLPRLDGGPMDALTALSFADMILNG